MEDNLAKDPLPNLFYLDCTECSFQEKMTLTEPHHQLSAVIRGRRLRQRCSLAKLGQSSQHCLFDQARMLSMRFFRLFCFLFTSVLRSSVSDCENSERLGNSMQLYPINDRDFWKITILDNHKYHLFCSIVVEYFHQLIVQNIL